MKKDSYLKQRPKSIAQVSHNVINGHDYTCAIKEFIDEIILNSEAPKTRYDFYNIPTSFFEDEPTLLDNNIYMAHLAGMAENLANLIGTPPPLWTENEIYFLKEPFYIGGSCSREYLFLETGSTFKRRHLFCGQSLVKFFNQRPRPEV